MARKLGGSLNFAEMRRTVLALRGLQSLPSGLRLSLPRHISDDAYTQGWGQPAATVGRAPISKVAVAERLEMLQLHGDEEAEGLARLLELVELPHDELLEMMEEGGATGRADGAGGGADGGAAALELTDWAALTVVQLKEACRAAVPPLRLGGAKAELVERLALAELEVLEKQREEQPQAHEQQQEEEEQAQERQQGREQHGSRSTVGARQAAAAREELLEAAAKQLAIAPAVGSGARRRV